MEASRLSTSHFRFGRCELDAARRSLTRRDRPVEIEPRVFGLLLYLIENHHRVVSTDELLDAVWGGAAVTPSSVSQAVHKARSAIDDSGQTQRSIVTVRGRGFRFVAPLQVGRSDPGEAPDGELVGRGVELVWLERLVERAHQGRGGLVFLAGARGIGKTRVVQEIVARTRARPAEAYVARCVEGDESIAFGPWRQLARKLAKGHTSAELAELGAHRIRELLEAERELSRSLPPGGARVPFDEAISMRWFASATAGLARLARDHPLLLVLEDVHRADVESLLYLRFLAHALPEHPILLVATFADGELAKKDRRAHLLAEAQRAANGETLTLEPLDPDETLRLAEKRIGRPMSGPLLDALCALSGGNPFLLGELLRMSTLRSESDRGGRMPGALELSATVRTAVTEQLGRLGRQGRRILAMAAVLGTEFELVPLASAVRLAPQKVFRSLTEAMAVRVVVPVERKIHAYRFVHALVREALYEDLAPRERAHHHLRAACALEASSRAGPALLAYHFCEAAAVGGAERGVEAACEAARLSASRLDFEQACREFALALRCLDFVPCASPLRRCEILAEAARAASRADPRRGSLLLVESARIVRRLDDSARALLDAIASASSQLESEEAGLARAPVDRLGPCSKAVPVDPGPIPEE